MKPSKNKRKQSVFSAWFPLLLVAIVALLVVLGIVVMPKVLYHMNEKNDESQNVANQEQQIATTEASQPEEKKEQGLLFPQLVADDKIEILSLSQFTGFNPDCGNEDGTDIAALQLVNLSEEYLEEAEISLLMADGSTLNFKVTDIPAGKSTTAFSVDNDSIELNAACKEITCQPVFTQNADLMEDKVDFYVNGMQVTLVNKSSEDLNNLVVYCHAALDEEYFGGITYKYDVETLAAGASTVVDAYDCLLGETAVVKISY